MSSNKCRMVVLFVIDFLGVPLLTIAPTYVTKDIQEPNYILCSLVYVQNKRISYEHCWCMVMIYNKHFILNNIG